MMNLAADSDALQVYLSEISRLPLLTVDQERSLAREYKEGNLRAGHQLVTANLRFVVKIAFEYRSYGLRMADMIQEGNLGLLRAVQKFQPSRETRLISYAVWWIRAFVQNYVLTNWSLVKLGTTQAQRKLFFALARTRRELEKQESQNHDEKRDMAVSISEAIAVKLKVKVSEVEQMAQRLGGRDSSLDEPVGEEGGQTHVEFVESSAASQETELLNQQESRLINEHVREALQHLDPRERFIIQARAMSDDPVSLDDLGQHFGFSRERARQLELRAKGKLKARLGQLHSELQDSAC